MLEIKLIRLYYYVCQCYYTQLQWQVQRFSRNSSKGQISDEELLTIYLFAVAYEQKQQLRQIYDYTLRYWSGWFPLLGSYQNFAYRLGRLSDCLPLLTELLMNELEGESSAEILLADSCPIITCSARRQPKVALELTGKGYCAAKKLYYYGSKLHLVAGRRAGKMPLPRQAGFTPANVHDLTALRPVAEEWQHTVLVADKAYADKKLKEDLLAQNGCLLTPPKQVKAKSQALCQFDKAAEDLMGKAVSSIRQPIESLVNWLEQRVNIQNASKVRSKQGLILHSFGKFAAALVFFIFN